MTEPRPIDVLKILDCFVDIEDSVSNTTASYLYYVISASLLYLSEGHCTGNPPEVLYGTQLIDALEHLQSNGFGISLKNS